MMWKFDRYNMGSVFIGMQIINFNFYATFFFYIPEFPCARANISHKYKCIKYIKSVSKSKSYSHTLLVYCTSVIVKRSGALSPGAEVQRALSALSCTECACSTHRLMCCIKWPQLRSTSTKQFKVT